MSDTKSGAKPNGGQAGGRSTGEGDGGTFNVLISSCGRRGALVRIFRSSLKKRGLSGRVLGADASPLSAALQMCDDGFLVPRCTDAAFIPAMVDLCRRHSIKLIVPTIDTELAIYAEARGRLSAVGTTVAVSAIETIRIGEDKARTHRWLIDSGFPAVRQWGKDEIPDSALFPLMGKPRFGSASMGIITIENRNQLALVSEREAMVFEERAPGREYTVDVFVDRRGQCRCAVPRLRLEVRGGEVSKAMTTRQRQLQALATEIAESLPGAFGVMNIQVFIDPKDGSMKVIEINPRFGGGFPLTWQAGADYPLWLIQDALGERCEARPDSWEDGLVMLRFDDAVFVSAGAVGLT